MNSISGTLTPSHSAAAACVSELRRTSTDGAAADTAADAFPVAENWNVTPLPSRVRRVDISNCRECSELDGVHAFIPRQLRFSPVTFPVFDAGK